MIVARKFKGPVSMDSGLKGAISRSETRREDNPVTLPRVRFIEKDGRAGEGARYPLDRPNV